MSGLTSFRNVLDRKVAHVISFSDLLIVLVIAFNEPIFQFLAFWTGRNYVNIIVCSIVLCKFGILPVVLH